MFGLVLNSPAGGARLRGWIFGCLMLCIRLEGHGEVCCWYLDLKAQGNEVRRKKLSLDLLMAWSERISYLNINR